MFFIANFSTILQLVVAFRLRETCSRLMLAFGITETWLDDCYHCSDIQGYTFLHNYRDGRSGGGAGFYLDDNVSFKQRSDLAFSDNSATESLFAELGRAKEKKHHCRCHL